MSAPRCVQCGAELDVEWSEKRAFGGDVVKRWIRSADCPNDCLGAVLPDEYR